VAPWVPGAVEGIPQYVEVVVVPLSRAQENAAVILLSSGAGQLNLAGGGALIAHGLIDRNTKDLDAFTNAMDDDLTALEGRVSDTFIAAGYIVQDASVTKAVRRLMVARGPRSRVGRPLQEVQIEMCTDYRALPAVPSRLGPLLDPLELGANKILAVYDRIRPRDADDLARLIPVLGLERTLVVADQKQVTPIDRGQLAVAFRQFARVEAELFPFPGMTGAVQSYMDVVARALEVGSEPDSASPYAADEAAESDTNVNTAGINIADLATPRNRPSRGDPGSNQYQRKPRR